MTENASSSRAAIATMRTSSDHSVRGVRAEDSARARSPVLIMLRTPELSGCPCHAIGCSNWNHTRQPHPAYRSLLYRCEAAASLRAIAVLSSTLKADRDIGVTKCSLEKRRSPARLPG